VVDQQETARLDALFKVSDCLLLFALIAKVVCHVGEGISEANDSVESSPLLVFDVVVER
jgi:hypothetical protein